MGFFFFFWKRKGTFCLDFGLTVVLYYHWNNEQFLSLIIIFSCVRSCKKHTLYLRAYNFLIYVFEQIFFFYKISSVRKAYITGGVLFFPPCKSVLNPEFVAGRQTNDKPELNTNLLRVLKSFGERSRGNIEFDQNIRRRQKYTHRIRFETYVLCTNWDSKLYQREIIKSNQQCFNNII